LYKCLYPADLQYLGSDPDLYKLTSGNRRVYELGINEEIDDYSDLANFIDILNNTPIEDLPCMLESIFNVNAFLQTIAFDILSGNWDGPLYNKNNFYLYHNEATGLFEYIPYDLDNTFGIDWFGIDWATRDIYNWGHTGEPRPIYWRILEVPTYRDRFSYYMDELVQTIYKEGLLFAKADSLKTLLAPYVPEDPFYPLDYGFTPEDFEQGFGQTLPYFHTKAGLKPFIASRRSATLNQLDLRDIAPIIQRVQHNHPNSIQDLIVRATVEDDLGIASVQLCYEQNGGSTTCIEMHDDGDHADEAANDQIYGVIVPAFGTSAQVTFTIRASDTKGSISVAPVCGQNELLITTSTVTLSVNEFMASNDTTITDNAGEYEDWVEIYNYGDESVYLGDLYLSDKEDNQTKWQFPDMSIAPGEYLLIWADEDDEQGPLHANFKLGAGGEYVGIYDHDINGNALIDGITFGPQETDAAFGRLPNGTGPFQILAATPGAENQGTTSTHQPGYIAGRFSVYPNPAGEVIHISEIRPLTDPLSIQLYNVLGHSVMEVSYQQNMQIDIRHLTPGIYTLVGVSGNTRVMKKIVIN
jgi:hypothetical protein